ncbi:MAG: proteasome accessory factor PafA2 family protein [Planctomycetota bacterium]
MSVRDPLPAHARSSGDLLENQPEDVLGKKQLCQRLIGTETEYAAFAAEGTSNLVTAPSGGDGFPTAEGVPTTIQQVYARVLQSIGDRQPMAPDRDDDQARFLANGAMVSLESQRDHWDDASGLIELATPEIRGPRRWLAWQKTLDRIVRDAALEMNQTRSPKRRVRFLKNSRDPLGNVYGSQENYEVEVARGLGLLVYRVAILLLWMVQLACWVARLPILAALITGHLLGRISWFPSSTSNGMGRLSRAFSIGAVAALRTAHWPMVVLLRFIARRLAFRRQQRFLTGLLVSRVSLCGDGHVEPNGLFSLSGKAGGIDRLSDLGGYRGERPIYVFGHWLEGLYGLHPRHLFETHKLLRRRQRMQIGLSDSNLSDHANWVKVGAVCLVLDMIDAGQTEQLPVLRRPIAALRCFNADWHLVRRVRTASGHFTSLEMQRAYFRAAQAFVKRMELASKVQAVASSSASVDPVGDEARDVLRVWEESIDSVTCYRKDAGATAQALGRVDWLSKRWMMDLLDHREDRAALQKVNLRFHELSPAGYHSLIEQQVPQSVLVSRAEVDHCLASAPGNSPAARRGWWIREFSDADQPAVARWDVGVLGNGRSRQRVRF